MESSWKAIPAGCPEELAVSRLKTFRDTSERIKFNFLSVGVFAYLFVLFFCLRWNAIVSRGRFNPDEAELLADGLRASKSFVPFKDFTSPTFGPIWPMFLSYLHRFGLPLSLPIAHLLSALILIMICKLVFNALFRRFSFVLALIIVTPLSLQLATGLGDSDYLSLSTELLPLLFLVTATAITYRQVLEHRTVFYIGLFFGLAVFSKYFFAPLVFIGMLMALSKAQSDGLRWVSSFKWLVLGFCLPMLLLVSVALLGGIPIWKILESPLMTFQYLQGGGLGTSACSGLDRLNNIRSSLSAHFSSFSLLLLGISLCISSGISLRNRHQALRIFLILSPPVVATFLLLSNCTIFPHYNYLLVGGVLQLFIASTSLKPSDKDSQSKSESRIVLSLYVFVIMQILLTNVVPAVSSPFAKGPEKSPQFLSAANGLWERAWDSERSPLSSFCAGGDSVLVWGWSPELYSFYDWEPASRYVTTTLMMDHEMFSHDLTTYRARLTDDVDLTSLDCVVIAVGPSFFGSFDENDSMKVQMPDLWNKSVSRLKEKTFYWDGVNPVTVLVPRQAGD
jgi:hypothetical protein